MIDEEPQRTVHPLVKTFVLMHLLLIAGWSLPAAAPAIRSGSVPPTVNNVLSHPGDFALKLNEDVKNNWPLQYYLTSTGLWQYWDMFAPNPASVDIWWDSIVTYQSGKVQIAKYPRMKELPLVQKYFKERYRKLIERVNNEATDSWKWPEFAQRMALMSTRDRNDLPTRVQLRRHYRELTGMYDPVPEKYTEYILFDYVVNQQKLKEDLN